MFFVFITQQLNCPSNTPLTVILTLKKCLIMQSFYCISKAVNDKKNWYPGENQTANPSQHCKYLQWKYSGKTVFCFQLQIFNCIWIAVQSMQKLRTKVVKTTFYCNPNIAVGLMLKSSSKKLKAKLILLYFFFKEIFWINR